MHEKASRTALDDAKGLRTHQRWMVEGCLFRMDLSLDACRDISAVGKSTSATRLYSLVIMPSHFPYQPFSF